MYYGWRFLGLNKIKSFLLKFKKYSFNREALMVLSCLAIFCGLFFVYLAIRNSGFYSMQVDETTYRKMSQLLPFSAATLPSYVYFWVYRLSSVCGNGFLGCARLLNSLFFVLAVPFIYLVCRQVLSRKTSLLITVLAVIGPINNMTIYFMPESMYFFSFWVFTWFVLTSLLMYNNLQESEEKFSAAFHAAPYLMAITSIVDGKIIEVNEGYSKLLGYSRAESVGKTTAELSIWANMEDRTTFSTNLEKFGEVINFETTLRRKDGTMVSVLDSARTIIIKKVKCILSIAQDITERKQAEEKLKELDRLKDDFLSTTTHELKTPLVPIKSQSQLLLAGDYGDLNQQQKEAVEMIYRNGETLNALSTEVLEIAKIKSNRLKLILERVDLSKIITEAVNDMKSLAEKKQLACVFLSIPKTPKTLGDAAKLRQVVVNLLDNAIKFTPEKGKVVVRLKKVKNELKVFVEDSGIGLSKSNIGKLFTPFFQVDSDVARKYRGTGLGLAVCKGIIEAHQGKIWVESKGEGKGSTFVFCLPIK